MPAAITRAGERFPDAALFAIDFPHFRDSQTGPMRQAILHIGLPKTGSTYLQRWLALNHVALGKIGLAVDSSPDFGHAFKRQFETFMETQRLPAQRFEVPGSSRGKAGLQTLISSEMFWQYRAQDVKRYFELRDLEISKVVMFLRRQDRLAASLYNQGIKAEGATHSFDHQGYQLDHLSLWTEWSEAFGSDKVVVLDYDRCANGEKVEEIFLSALGFPLLDNGLVPAGAVSTNPSPDAATVEIMRPMNLRGHPPANLPLKQYVLDRLSRGRPYGISQSKVTELEEISLNSNRALVQRLGGEGFQALTSAGWQAEGVDLEGCDVTEKLVELLSVVADITHDIPLPAFSEETMRPYVYTPFPTADITSDSRADEIVAITKGNPKALQLFFARATNAGVFDPHSSRTDVTPAQRTEPVVARTTFNQMLDLVAFGMHLIDVNHAFVHATPRPTGLRAQGSALARPRTFWRHAQHPRAFVLRTFYRARYFYLDPDYYLAANPDVAAAGIDPYVHYGKKGIGEKRRPRQDSLYERFEKDSKLKVPRFTPRLQPDKRSVLVVLHEGTRTGAPLIGYNVVLCLLRRYNVIVVALENGPIVRACTKAGAQVIAPDKGRVRSWLLAGEMTRKAIGTAEIDFAVVNSIEARFVQRRLSKDKIPTVLLVHEFASSIRPLEEYLEALDLADAVIFPSRIVRENAETFHPGLDGTKVHVRAQGICRMPEDRRFADKRNERPVQESDEEVRNLLGLANAGDDRVTVVGIGAVNYRKGVDLFIQCAAAYFAAYPDANTRFVWVGSGYDPEADGAFSSSLADQIGRSALEGRVTFAGEIKNMDAVYRNADILALTSRLDPMPNVAIEAFSAAMPVVCFARAAGTGETLEDAGVAAVCVAEYLNTQDMASKIAGLAHSPALLAEVGTRLQQHVEGQFDFDDYAAFIENLATAMNMKGNAGAEGVAM